MVCPAGVTAFYDAQCPTENHQILVLEGRYVLSLQFIDLKHLPILYLRKGNAIAALLMKKT
jgi:hypothetical protein